MTTAAGRGTLRAASGLTLRRWAVGLAGLGLATLGAVVPQAAQAATVACAGGGPCLVVKVVGAHGAVQATQQFSADQINQDPNVVTGPVFNIRALPNGGETQVSNVAQALPLTDLIPEVTPGLSWNAVQYAEVVDLHGVSHDLDHDQLGPPATNGFVDGLSPSVWASTGQGGDSDISMNFFRPLKANDPQDTNAFDLVKTSGTPDQALVIVLHTTGKLLHPTIATHRTEVRVGSPQVFRATFPASDGALPAGLHYGWYVGQEQVWTGPPPSSHTWSTPGTYQVYLQVSGADSTGQSESVQVTVCPKAGNTATCTTPKPGPGPGNPGGGDGPGSPSGPVGGQGNHPGTHRHGHHPQPPSQQPPQQSPGNGPGGSPGETHSPSGSQSHHHARTGPGSGGPKDGRTVAGQLLVSSAAYVVPRHRPGVTAAAPPAAPTEPQWAWQWKWAGLLVVPLLIGLGMAGESRQLRRRVARMGT